MNTNELRIGNIIQSNGKFETVKSLQDDEINYTIQSAYSGIPLTEEILFKCGFCKEMYKTYFYMNDIYLIKQVKRNSNPLMLSYFWFDFILNENKISEVKYLHQLQNLYFALNQMELPISDK